MNQIIIVNDLSRFRLAAAYAAFFIFTIALASAQSADTSATAENPPNQIVKMSSFEVTTTQGHGYVTTNATSGLKTDESMMDIPQGILVVTNDLINDIGYVNTSDILQFVGVADTFVGETTAIRGMSTSYAYIDDMPLNQSFGDDVNVDSFEIIKGPTQFLYLNASLGGIVVISTKKPLPFNQDIVTAQINDWGQYRFTADATGPLATFSDSKIGYRVVLADQGGGNWAQNVKDDHQVIFVALQAIYHDATFRLDYDYDRITSLNNATDLITPSGQLYTGAGRSETGTARNSMAYHPTNRYGFHWIQKISDTFDSKFQASMWEQLNYGGVFIEVDPESWTSRIVNPNSKERSPCRRNVVSTVPI